MKRTFQPSRIKELELMALSLVCQPLLEEQSSREKKSKGRYKLTVSDEKVGKKF